MKRKFNYLKKKSSLEKAGYHKQIPKGSDISDYEIITVINKNGDTKKLFRHKKEKQEIDDTKNFESSWDIFNSLL